MLVRASHLINTPVLSFQTAQPLGLISNFVIEPTSFKIIAFLLSGPEIDQSNDTLAATSIREYSPLGFIVDSADELISRTDVVKIRDILALNFALPGLKVETRRGTKLGTVLDFSVVSDNFSIQQIIVRRPTLKGLLDPELTIPRSEITEVTDDRIIVKDEEKTIRARAGKEDFIPNFVNPFRGSQRPAPAPARTRTPAGKDTL